MDYTKDESVFNAAVSEAKASGQLFRTEQHLTLGGRVVFLTGDEVAKAQASTVAESQKPAPTSAGAGIVKDIIGDPEALAVLKAAMGKS